MIFPVRCFSCNKVIGDCWLKYLELVKEEMEKGRAQLRMRKKGRKRR